MHRLIQAVLHPGDHAAMKVECGEIPLPVASPHRHESLSGLVVLYPRGKSLQNGGTTIVRLTSRGESPYFPKLDSSFCQVGPHEPSLAVSFQLVSKLHPVEVGRDDRAWHPAADRVAPGPLAPVSRRSNRRVCFSSTRAGRPVAKATHGIYERARLRSCQRKGDRPRGGFRLPWARCQADAWEAQLGAHTRDRLTR